MIFSIVGQWSHRQQGDKWVVSKWASERIRVCTNGTILYHGDPLENQVAELYEFQTEWAAKSHARFCNRLDQYQFDTISFTQPLHLTGGMLIGQSNQFEFLQSGKVVVRIGCSGDVQVFNLPYLAWIWLRTTWLGRGLKAFWYGWGK